MTTPTDTPAAPEAWTAWRAKHLELAIACEDAAIVAFCVQGSTEERTWTAAQYKLDAARAALEAHLDAVPMGEPEAWRDPSNLNATQCFALCKETAEKWPHIYSVPLYRHPKESA